MLFPAGFQKLNPLLCFFHEPDTQHLVRQHCLFSPPYWKTNPGHVWYYDAAAFIATVKYKVEETISSAGLANTECTPSVTSICCISQLNYEYFRDL